MNKVDIYSKQITPRLQYACNIIFKIILKIDYAIISEIEKSTEIAINYSSEKIKASIQITPSGILEQKGVQSHNLNPGECEGIKTLFRTHTEGFPFDIFSAVFYMCSRYEEYLPFEPDEHGRFTAQNSVANRYGFIKEPIVEQWVQKLAKELKLDFPLSTFKSLLTIDVDDAWKYKNRPFFLNLAKLIRSLLTFKFKDFGFQLSIMLNVKKDPWFTFNYLADLEKRLNISIQYFFLLGKKRPYDTAISLKKKAFRKLIQKQEQKNKVGIHPSYQSNSSINKLRKEFFDLSVVNLGKAVHSRQHFLIFKFPDTFRNLIKLGIIEEHSLGWANTVGFRAGISRPFPFYDILAEKESHMMFVPFMIMDRTIKDYMSLSTTEAITELKMLIDKVKAIGGQFTMLWHNDSVSNFGEWNGWRKVFEEALEYAAKKND